MTNSWVETGEETIKSRSQLRSQLQSMLNEQELTEERVNEVLSALDVDNIQVSDVMISKEDIDYISTENTHDENKRIISETTKSRYPLVGESIDDVRGIIYIWKDSQERHIIQMTI